MAETQKEKTNKRVVSIGKIGRVHIKASYNNVVVSIANLAGDVISWATAGSMGFKGSKKNTPFAAQMAADKCARKAFDLGIHKADVHVKGPGVGRESAIRAVQSAGIEVSAIKDITPIPHNGCRPPKRRRP